MFASRLFLEALDVADTCNLKTTKGVWGHMPPFITSYVTRLYNGAW